MRCACKNPVSYVVLDTCRYIAILWSLWRQTQCALLGAEVTEWLLVCSAWCPSNSMAWRSCHVEAWARHCGIATLCGSPGCHPSPAEPGWACTGLGGCWGTSCSPWQDEAVPHVGGWAALPLIWPHRLAWMGEGEAPTWSSAIFCTVYTIKIGRSQLNREKKYFFSLRVVCHKYPQKTLLMLFPWLLWPFLGCSFLQPSLLG